MDEINPTELVLQINFYFSITVVPIGIVINILSIFIFKRKSLNKNTNMGYMYSTLSLFNICALMNSILFTQFLPYFDIDITSYSEYGCKFLNLWRRFAKQSPSIHQILIAFMFYFSVKQPNRSRFIQDKRVIAKIMCLNAIVILIVNSLYLFFKSKKKANIS